MPKTVVASRSKPRAPTMTAQEVIARINNHHRKVIFPNMFEQLTFDMFAEVEYSFVIDKKIIRVTRSEFWVTSDRNVDKGHFAIEFKPEDGKKMGRWLHHVVDPNTTKGSGKIGFTLNQNVTIPDDTSIVAIEEAFRNKI